MNYCSHCGSATIQEIPEGDSRERDVCTQCKTIHYQNPNIVAGTIPVFEDKVLLCKRAIEPRKGYWTLPAGFMENGESTSEAALRETWEEAEANPSIDGLYTIINLPQLNQVHIFFRATLSKPEFGVGPESLETQLFAEEDIPWDDISFLTVADTLRYFFADRKQGTFIIREEKILTSAPGVRI